ncbi:MULTISPECIES: hypothetical protein [unclassified Rhodanobacter]|uniref:Uncharacterized protein n=1 Tax=Rhodanobacter humi TaxID=1888173 RepID=A0ABV4AWY7_9GAMM
MTELSEGPRRVVLDGSAHTYSPWTVPAETAPRGDFVKFVVILVLVREAFACADFDLLDLHVRDLYTLLPCIAQLDWVRPDVDLLLQCIEDMMARSRWGPSRVEIDWKVFRSQVENPQPWDGHPPWIVSTRGERAESRSNQLLRRPVPLFEGIEPLAEYVRPQEDEVPQIQTRRGDSFWDRLINRMESLPSKRESP